MKTLEITCFILCGVTNLIQFLWIRNLINTNRELNRCLDHWIDHNSTFNRL